MTADMSVAPEIARLAETVTFVSAEPDATSAATPDTPAGHPEQLTLGSLAGRLRSIAGTPERWWSLVRFEPDRSVQIMVEECAAYRAWLTVLPPGGAGRSCDCDVATMIAGEATEGTPGRAVLRPGPVRVHAERHGLRGGGTGYSISLHARAHRSTVKK